jgi:hypothetical protein
MKEPDYDRIRDRETNRYLDRMFDERDEWTAEDRADARRDDQVLELPESVRGAGTSGL